MLGLGGGLSFGGALNVAVPNPIRNALTLVTDDFLTFPLSTPTYWQDIFRGSFSFGVWVKPTDGQPAAVNGIFGTFFMSGSFVFNQLSLRIETNGKLRFTQQGNSDPYLEETDAAVFVNGQNDWVHVLVVSELNEGGSTDAKIYVNGELEATTATGALSSANHKLLNFGTFTPKLGAIANLSMAGMAGNADEFALWDDTLTAAEVLAIYNGAKPFNLDAASSDGNYPSSAAGDLQVYLRMGDGTNDNITPLTGNQIEIFNQAINTSGGVQAIVNGNFSDQSSSESGGLDTYSGFKEIVADEITIQSGTALMQIGQTVVANGNATAVALAANGSTDVLPIGGTYGYRLQYEIEEKGAGFVGFSAIIGGTTYALPEEVGHNTAYLTSGSSREFQLINEHVADAAADNCHIILQSVSLTWLANNQIAIGVGVSDLDTETYNDLA